MNPIKTEMLTARTTAPWVKKTLIALLILSVIGGFSIAAYFLVQSASVQTEGSSRLTELYKNSFAGLSSFLKEGPSAEPKGKIPLTFQGTLLGEKGAIAMINDEMAVVGAEIGNARILSITNRTVVIEYRGEELTLSVGETRWVD